MTIIEKRQQIDDAIAALEKLNGEASLADTPVINDAIIKLIAKKELIITDSWDEFKIKITDEDFEKLKDSKAAIDDATIAEQAKIEKVNQGIAIGKKILGVLKMI